MPSPTGSNGSVALVVNGASRSGARANAAAVARLRTHGVDLAVMHTVEDPSTMPRVVADVVEQGHGTVVVGGGDGTISCAAGALAAIPAERRPTLGVLPLGTANDFARTLDIPRALDEACRTVADGKVVDVDLGRANGVPFLNVASLGLSVEVTRALGPGLKRRLGPAAYPVATLMAYRRHRPFRARLTFPAGDFDPIEPDDLLQVAVGNGRHYGGGNTIAPDAGIDDHSLDVYAIRRGRLRDHVSIARLLKSGTFIDHDQVQHLTTRAVEVTTYDEHGAPLTAPVNLDGEILTETPALFRIERNALDVLVPQHVTHARRDPEETAQA